MINFDLLEKNLELYAQQFKNNKLFEHIVIDNFCEVNKLSQLLETIPDPIDENVNKSRDYFFAKNKYEKSKYKDYGKEFTELYNDLVSKKFEKILKKITGEEVFVDREFHGGGLHQGGKGSYLNMHADFNYHPVNKNWYRNLNILLYLNNNWRKEYGGQLKLKNKNTGETAEIDPLFNRCVIMFTRDYTLHGYDPINFPQGEYRRSIASYAYTIVDKPENTRSTTWYPEGKNIIKQMLGKKWPKLVKIKNKIFGSSTVNNK